MNSQVRRETMSSQPNVPVRRRPWSRYSHEIVDTLSLVWDCTGARRVDRVEPAHRLIRPMFHYECSFCREKLVPAEMRSIRRLLRLAFVRDYVCPHCFDHRLCFDRSVFGLFDESRPLSRVD